MADLAITVTVDDINQLVLKDDLTDIDQWVQSAMKGKINHAWKRFRSEWIIKLMNDESFTGQIPSNKSDFVALVTSRADYKDRAARDAANAPA